MKSEASIRDVTGRPDNTQWKIYTPTPVRAGEDAGSIITNRPRTIQPLDGEISVDLEPGLAVIEFGANKWVVDIPEADTDLWAIIAAAQAFPPNPAAGAVAAAIASYMNSNPVVSMLPEGIVGASDPGLAVITGTAAEGRSALDATSPDDVADLAFDPTDVGFDVVLVAGQSNAVGYTIGASAINTTYLDPVNERIMQWPGTGAYTSLARPVVAIDPLFHREQKSGTVGPAMEFARQLLRRTKPNRKILLVPAAHGQTGFTTSSLGSPPVGYTTAPGGGWDPSGDQGGINLYALAIAQANAALAHSPNNRIVAVLWVQGETDQAMTQSAYAAKLDALIDGFRSGITGAANVPFLIGQMVPERIVLDADYQNINKAHIDTPRRKLRASFSYGAAGHNDGLGMPLHYDNEGQRLNGIGLAAVLDLALANVLDADPVAPGAVSLSQSTTSVLVTWARTAGRVTDYNVRYRVNAGSWTNLTRTQSIDNTAVITAMTLGNAVEVQVRSVNEEGVSAWNAGASITLAKLPGQASVALGTPTGSTIPFTITAPTVNSTFGAATSYLVQYKLHSEPTTWTTAGTVTALTGSITGLVDSTQYDVRVTAVNAAGSSATPSATQSAYTAAPAPLLDDVAVTAYRAHGLRKLRGAYSGAAIRVRYTDATEEDIGFAVGTNNLDTAALLAGAAAHGGSAWIKTWYDQSANARHVTQSTNANQARIVNSNVLDTKGGKAAAVFSSSTYVDSTNIGLYAAGASSALAVYSSTKGSFLPLAAERGSSGSQNYTLTSHHSGGTLRCIITDDAGTVTTATGPTLADATQAQISAVDTGTSVQNWVDGAAGAATAYSRAGRVLTMAQHTIGASTPSASYLVGTMSELVEFPVALTDPQRVAGALNQKTYYGTA